MRCISRSLRSALAPMREPAVRQQVQFEVSIEKTDHALLVDRVQIQQVLVNLFRNALEAMANSDKKELSAGNTLAEARTRTFSWRSKVFLASTPTIHGVSRIEREFEASDQRRFFVPCPHCQHRQWLRFERLRWEKGKPDTAHYQCEACAGEERRWRAVRLPKKSGEAARDQQSETTRKIERAERGTA